MLLATSHINRVSYVRQVAFFLPQLVQQLRRDEGGLVREFLLDAAQRSKLFAHHLVWFWLHCVQCSPHRPLSIAITGQPLCLNKVT